MPEGLDRPERLARLGERFALFAGCYAGAVVGAAVLELSAERAVLAPLYVEPAAREVGVGRCLLETASRYAASAGAIALDVPALPGDRETKALLEQSGGRARLVVMERVLR
ncbi:MAG: GNAT family N-acetyltransferase [Actinomycetota bacterium]|nr:GNAT family N-acetyltransferase [Actinomycetota bacterium]